MKTPASYLFFRAYCGHTPKTTGGASIGGLLVLLALCASLPQTAQAMLCTQALTLGSSLTQLRQAFEHGSRKWKSINEMNDRLSIARDARAGGNHPPAGTIACAGPPGLMASIGESPGRLHLHWGDPPEARKAFALTLGKGPKSPFIKTLKN